MREKHIRAIKRYYFARKRGKNAFLFTRPNWFYSCCSWNRYVYWKLLQLLATQKHNFFYNMKISLLTWKICIIKYYMVALAGWLGVRSQTPEDDWFSSWSGHICRFWVPSSFRAPEGVSWWMFLSHINISLFQKIMVLKAKGNQVSYKDLPWVDSLWKPPTPKSIGWFIFLSSLVWLQKYNFCVF